nr:RNA-directed DNA polymerase, eukaryota [Tanacetum cinerariifolium]
MDVIDLFDIKRCWGNFVFDYVYGNSGGILCVWDTNSFKKLNATVSDYFILLRGNWVSNGKLFLIVSVYAPQELTKKKMLWEYLMHVMASWKGDVIIIGDFNEAGLKEIPLGGCSFTWCHKSGSKMSKLDRFLVSKSFLSVCPTLSSITLDRFLLDHRPILLRESTYDYGPSLFRFFKYWAEVYGFEKLIVETWSDITACGSNDMLNLMHKLKILKKKIRGWNSMRQSFKNSKIMLKSKLADVELVIDKENASEEVIYKRLEIVNSINELEKQQSMKSAQKAKIKWAIEGDENSKYYHGILNKKGNNLAIRGVLEAGKWIKNPKLVKKEFLNHFKNRFGRPNKTRHVLVTEFPR